MERCRPESGSSARAADLAERERRTATGPFDPRASAQLAAERDSVADEQDDGADARDEAARTRRRLADERDARASARDRRSRQAFGGDAPGFRERFLAGRDADASAGDRADALDDERLARHDRQRARHDRQLAAADRDRAVEVAAETAVEADHQATTLRAAIESRTVIGQAQGLLMARHGLSAERAFTHLVHMSQTRNVKLRDLARSLVDDADPERPDAGR